MQKIEDPFLSKHGVSLYVKRDDLIHPFISGNKWRKLKYNLQEAKTQKKDTLLSFGGAYSNHIYSLAAAGKFFGFKTIGLIRGEEHFGLNPTLAFAKACGMKLYYLDREAYRLKENEAFIKNLILQFGDHYIIPEGGSNEFAVKGCEEIISEINIDYDYICCAAGTGGTMAGLVKGLNGKVKVLGFSALKADGYFEKTIPLLLDSSHSPQHKNWSIIYDYHFGGYAKITKELLLFIEQFKIQNDIELEPIYTGKLLFGLYDLIKKGFFQRGETIIAIHTGGLQALEGLKEKIPLVMKQ